MTPTRRPLLAAALALPLALALAACAPAAAPQPEPFQAQDGVLQVYSSQHRNVTEAWAAAGWSFRTPGSVISFG